MAGIGAGKSDTADSDPANHTSAPRSAESRVRRSRPRGLAGKVCLVFVSSAVYQRAIRSMTIVRQSILRVVPGCKFSTTIFESLLTKVSALAHAWVGPKTAPCAAPLAPSPRHFSDGYFSFVRTLSPPFRFIVIWFFAASNSITMPAAVPLSILNLSWAVASSGTADAAPGGCA